MSATNYKSCAVRGCRKRKDLDSDGLCPNHKNPPQDPPASEPELVLSDNCDCFQCGSVVLDSEDAVECDLCDKFFHISCVKIAKPIHKGLTDTSSILVGLKWFCGSCIEAIEGFKTGTKKTENPKEPNVTDSHGSRGYSDETSRNKNICRDYRHGKCKHGTSGKKQLDGTACKFSHPRKCLKFCKFGRDPNRGCDKSQCEYFHPIICRYSAKKSECLNESCSYTHLVGTSRNKPRYRLPTEEHHAYTPRTAIPNNAAPSTETGIKPSCSYADAAKYGGCSGTGNDVMSTIMTALRELQDQQARMQAEMFKFRSLNNFQNPNNLGFRQMIPPLNQT